MNREHWNRCLMAVTLAALLLVSACAPSPTTTPPSVEPEPTPTPTSSPTPTPSLEPTPQPTLQLPALPIPPAPPWPSGWFLLPHSSKPSTYTNSEYGFSLEYLGDWWFEEDLAAGGDWTGIVAFGRDVEEVESFTFIAIMSVELPQSPKVTLEDYYSHSTSQFRERADGLKLTKEDDITISGLPAKTLAVSAEPFTMSMVFFLKENTAYFITYDVPMECYDDYLDCFELVLSTFRFE